MDSDTFWWCHEIVGDNAWQCAECNFGGMTKPSEDTLETRELCPFWGGEYSK